jgi:hypothetical protein
MILSLATIEMLFILLHVTRTFSRLSWRIDFERSEQRYTDGEAEREMPVPISLHAVC